MESWDDLYRRSRHGYGQFERGEIWLHFLLLDERPLPRRVVIIGRGVSAELCVALAHTGFALCVVGTESEMEVLYREIRSGAPSALRRISFVYQSTGPYIFREGDAVVLLRVIHHAEKPAEMLSDILDAIPRGSSLLIADMTTELFGRQQEEWIHVRQYMAERIAIGDSEQFEQVVAKREADNEICRILLDGHRFTDKQAIRRFLKVAGMQEESFDYAPKCICMPQGWCGHYAQYWIATAYKR